MTDLSLSPKFKVEPDSTNPLDSPFYIVTSPRLPEREELISLFLPTFPQTSRKRTLSASHGPRKRSPTLDRLKAIGLPSAETFIDMNSMSETFNTWNQSESRDQNPQITIPFLSRRSSDGDQMHHQYAFAPSFESGDRRGSYNVDSRTPASSSSSGSSSLSGAMGPTPSSPPDDAFQNPDPNISWDGHIMTTSPNTRVINHISSPMITTPTGQTPYSEFGGRFGENPLNSSPRHANFVLSHSFAPSDGTRSPHMQSVQSQIHIAGQYPAGSSGGLDMHGTPSPPRIGYPPEMIDEEILRLRSRIHQLEALNASLQQRNVELERKDRDRSLGGLSSAADGLLSTLPHALTPEYKASWRARTEARVKRFCSLNRAGNALCAWHDSRRERRTYPPRLAPPGYLNCGCSIEEALFEESLARHDIGSYHPGDSVRMDPALRNPLLKLLQQRYGYADGDFERNPISGRWIEGEGPELWEATLASNTSTRRRGDSHR